MKFYKENDVNPFGSCLPLLLQAPVFIALYYTLRSQNFADGSDLSFMYVIPDVSKLLTQIGWAVIPLVAVYAVSQLISTELSAQPTMSKNQRWLMRLLPGQQLVLKRRIEADIEANGGTLLTPKSKDDDADADDVDAAEDGAEEATEATPAGAVAAVATEDVEVRTKSVPRRRRRKKDQVEQGEAAGANGASAPTDAPPAQEASNGAAAGESSVSAVDAEATPDAGSDAADEAAPATGKAQQGGGSKKRKPPARKVKGGPGRPASRKPPKRRK